MDTTSKPAKFDPLKPPRIVYANGQSESMDFRTLGITERQRFIRFLEERDTVGLVAFCCNRNLKWIDSLTEATFDDLANYFFLVNFPWVMERASRDPITATILHSFTAAMDRVMTAHPDLLQEAIAKATKKASSQSAPSTTSSPSAASDSQTGSASPTAPAPAATAAAISPSA